MAGHSPDSEPPTREAAAAARCGSPFVHVHAGGLLPSAALPNLIAEARAAVAQAFNALNIPPVDCGHSSRNHGEVRVRLVADAEMADAHLKYADIPGTTDVLTFDLADGASARGEPLDVDLLICVDEARRQSVLHGHALEREILLYILHGVLHCLGHNDHDDDAYERMHAEEDRILRAIGIGPVFNPAGANPPCTIALTDGLPVGLRAPANAVPEGRA